MSDEMASNDIPGATKYEITAPGLTQNKLDEIEAAFDAATGGQDASELLGDCLSNAVRLYDELEEVAPHRRIVRGGLDLPDEPTPLTKEAFREYGLAHWWVEARIGGIWYTLDLASEAPDYLGSRLITHDRPTAYLPFEFIPDDSDVFAVHG